MKLTENQLTTIVYEKESGETSARVIIPTKVPTDLIKAIDLSELDPAERARMANLHEEYRQYVAAQLKTLLTFENWVDHSYNEEIKPKWRSFKVSGLR